MNINDITDTKEDYAKFKAKCALEGKTLMQVLNELVKRYIEEEEG